MSDSNPETDRTHPDHEWTGNSSAASNDDVSAAVRHLKNWMMRELDSLRVTHPTEPAP